MKGASSAYGERWYVPFAAFLVNLGFHMDTSALLLEEEDNPSFDPIAQPWWQWLREKSSSPRYLQELCRLEVLGSLGHTHFRDKINSFPLPQPLKDLLTPEGFVRWCDAKQRVPDNRSWESLLNMEVVKYADF